MTSSKGMADALEAIGKALEGLVTDEQRRVILAAGIIVGAFDVEVDGVQVSTRRVGV